jgi:hypothetical protein
MISVMAVMDNPIRVICRVPVCVSYVDLDRRRHISAHEHVEPNALAHDGAQPRNAYMNIKDFNIITVGRGRNNHERAVLIEDINDIKAFFGVELSDELIKKNI